MVDVGCLDVDSPKDADKLDKRHGGRISAVAAMFGDCGDLDSANVQLLVKVVVPECIAD